jgi:glycosyltransferase involved in cell wall biosynthesis
MLNSAARIFAELAEGLRKRGHSVTVLTEKPERYVSEETAAAARIAAVETVDGVRVVRLSPLPLPKHIPCLRAVEQLVSLPRYTARGCRLGKFDCVIAYSPPLTLAMAAALIAHRSGGRAIANIQDPYPKSAVDLGLLSNPVLVRMGEWMERWVYRHVDAITVHAEGMRTHVVEHGGTKERVHVIPNWIDLHRFSPGPRGNAFRRVRNLSKAFVISYAGVMGFAQQVEDILEAAERLQLLAPEALFLLAGEGGALPRLKKLAAEKRLANVQFLGHLPEAEYLELLRASDVCLVTLARKLQTPVIPGKLACIMGAGRAVVCCVPETSGARQLVEDTGCGIWVPAGNPDLLMAALLQIYRNPEMRAGMEDSARRYAEMWLSSERGIGQYSGILDALVSQ